LAIVDAGTDVVEVWKGRKDFIPKRHRRHHLIDVAGEPNPKKTKQAVILMVCEVYSAFGSQHMPHAAYDVRVVCVWGVVGWVAWFVYYHQRGITYHDTSASGACVTRLGS